MSREKSSNARSSNISRLNQARLRCAVIEALEHRTLLHSGHEHLSVDINFQASTTVTPAGYLADVGLTYGQRSSGLFYGWNSSATDGARDRNDPISPDERYDTFVKLKSTGNWQIAVPNGTYDVRLVAGDPSTDFSVYKINVEGLLAIDGTPSSTTHWFENTVTVNVTDGKLTITNAPGGIENRLAFIEIDTADQPDPTETPNAPSGVDAMAISSTQIRVQWTDNATNESGFRVQRKTGDDGLWNDVASIGENETQFVDNDLAPNTRYVYRVIAFNSLGDSGFSNEDGSTTFQNAPTGTTITWQTVASSPIKRAEANGTVVNGKLYVFGGLYSSSSGSILASKRSDVYNPATNTWTRIKDQPEAVTHAPSIVVGDTIWFIGGYVGNHPGPATRHVWKYNTTTNAWSRGPDLPTNRGAGGAGIVGNKIYFFGGMNMDRTADRGNLFVLDLNNQSPGWIEKASLPNPRNHVAGIAVNGFLYAIGGQYSQEENQVAQSDIHRYDPTTDTWTKVAQLSVGRSHVTSSVFLLNGKIVILGGETGYAQPIRNVTLFDPITNTLTEMSPLPSIRSSSVAGLLPDGRIISSTGNNPGASTTTWIGTIS